MRNSADIKKANINTIRKALRGGTSLSKQEVAARTGLSVATCNTFLNEMEKSGEAIGEKCRIQDVGRSTTLYHLNPDFRNILCISFEKTKGVKNINIAILSSLGDMKHSWQAVCGKLDFPATRAEIQKTLNEYRNISVLMVGIPGIADHGTIRHCDIPELEGVNIISLLEQEFHIPAIMENDMYYKAFGFYHSEKAPDDIVTIVNYPSGVLPGTATVYQGTVLKGKNLFAGMVGYMDYDMLRQEQIQLLQPGGTAFEIIKKAVTALITVINPDKMLFTGDLLDEREVMRLWEACLMYIPADYMPEFRFVEDMSQFYLAGMYWTAVEQGMYTDAANGRLG